MLYVWRSTMKIFLIIILLILLLPIPIKLSICYSKENYYIKKYYGDFVLLKQAKNKENCKKVLEKVGVYGTLREVKEAIIKEMIKDEVNHRKTEPLYKLIPLMRQMYNRFYEENMECCFVG